MLKRLNKVLPELILGILIYGILVQITGIWFVKDKLSYSIVDRCSFGGRNGDPYGGRH